MGHGDGGSQRWFPMRCGHYDTGVEWDEDMGLADVHGMGWLENEGRGLGER